MYAELSALHSAHLHRVLCAVVREYPGSDTSCFMCVLLYTWIDIVCWTQFHVMETSIQGMCGLALMMQSATGGTQIICGTLHAT